MYLHQNSRFSVCYNILKFHVQREERVEKRKVSIYSNFKRVYGKVYITSIFTFWYEYKSKNLNVFTLVLLVKYRTNKTSYCVGS